MKMRTRWLVSRCGLSLILASSVALMGGCTSDDCKDGAFAKDGICLPICPGVTCGDKVCTRYYWPDGSWNSSLHCETAKSCPQDCSNADANLAQVILFSLFAIDSDPAVPNPADSVSVNVSCSGGGQALVTGSQWCRSAIDLCMHDFVYTVSNCAHTTGYPAANITLASGSLEASWSYQDSTSHGPSAYQVTGQVSLHGTLSVGEIPDQTSETLPPTPCAVSFEQASITSGGTTTTKITGTMCGRTIVPPVYSP